MPLPEKFSFIKKLHIPFLLLVFSIATGIAPKDKSSLTSVDTAKTSPQLQGIDTTSNKPAENNTLQIDTGTNRMPPTSPATTNTVVPADTLKRIDSAAINSASESTLTNTKLFIYIILSLLGLALFFYIFVISLFRTFHRKKSTRQSLLLSWNLFFVVAIIWIFIIWGLVAGFWTSASFTVVVIFLFIISLIMTIIAVKSK